MKKRLTVNVDAELIPAVKRRARALGVSLSSLLEQRLREILADERGSVTLRAPVKPKGESAEPTAQEPNHKDRTRKQGLDAPEPTEPNTETASWAQRRRGIPSEDAVDEFPEFELPPGEPPREGATSWVQQWAGILEGTSGPPPGENPRYDHLARKYDL